MTSLTLLYYDVTNPATMTSLTPLYCYLFQFHHTRLADGESDPLVMSTAFKKNRFFIFSRREPVETGGDVSRDVFNLKPTKDEQMAATRYIPLLYLHQYYIIVCPCYISI